VALPDLLRETGALLDGHFRLSSGLHSPGYVQCALLLEQPENAKSIGQSLADLISAWQPSHIVAPALGGVVIGFVVAAALNIPFVFTERKEGVMTLRRGFRLAPGEPVVIVEDVVTTGKSTRETAEVIQRSGGVVTGFASILNRSASRNPFQPAPYSCLMELELATFEERDCPLCASGVPIDAPGSRYSQAQ
jgi:orotate phosphoribosyltransferase